MSQISRKSLYFVLCGLLLTCIGGRFLPHIPLKQRFPYSIAVYDEQQNLLRLTTAKDQKYRLWTSLEELSPQLVNAVLFQEDEWFYYHFGVNPYGLLRGATQTYLFGGSPQGGSTITMQLARILWKIDSRTIGGKIEQILRAIQLELQYSKREILEAYFNFAPYGRNIEGAGTASLIYFNRASKNLNLAEAMTLAILPKNPNAYIQQNNQQLNPQLFNVRNKLYARWVESHPKDRQWQSHFKLNYPLRPLEKLPFFAPHFTDQVLQQYAESEAIQNGRIVTGLNSGLQRLVERISLRYLQQQKPYGVNNLAVLLVDNRTMQIKALVGSGDYFNQHISGQINGTLAKRSYGSTLKPFIYGLAFDQGLVHPKTILKDLPTTFADYQPENYEGNFLGPVSVTQALLQSRNIPAVDMAQRLKYPDLYDLLKQAKITLPKEKAHYGLSLVLGGAELSMQQLAGLYAALANGGQWRPLHTLKSAPAMQSTTLLSPESSYMLGDILSQNIRTDIYNKAIKTKLPIYWKTGTSNGLRDAWTAGYFGNYTLVVWLGNFNNKSNPHFIGRRLAAPLFLQLADGIIAQYPNMKNPLSRDKLKLTEVPVCAADGNLPNKYCQQLTKTLFIPGKSPIQVSNTYQQLRVRKGTDVLACATDPNAQTEQKIYEIWGSDYQKMFAQAGIMKRNPIVNVECPYEQQNQSLQQITHNPLKMTSPLENRTYYINMNSPENHIPLTATTSGEVQHLYWFVNNAYLGESSASKAFLWQPAKSGTYQITVADEQGHRTGVSVVVSVVR
ncbi:penicillin-binding protein 1C [Aggregatibacter actinomycetemcomitans]|uniref:penicillin-binding protein 1C n=1 Tax=Aggregatibacter actinomycetemcomitans TaxID=714 RepID=UPI00197C9F8E|nr:penicillin-binding protein 1C [Aggregatibacter actinomycetemcomitans]MBN6075725.1 penicillin-binding protein 1C [Aggregatibacter actinomycetemcomitans]